MKHSARHIAAAAAVALLAGSCLSPHQSSAVDVDPNRWETGAEILLPNTDTATLRDAAIFLRCNDRFREDTLTLRIATRTPDSLRYGEWFLLVIPRSKAPAALTREVVIDYRHKLHFSQRGDYRCTITPVRPVRGVEAVGLNIVKSK